LSQTDSCPLKSSFDRPTNSESLRGIPFDDVMDDDTDQSQWGRVCGYVVP
jgi:hypothetical protein